MLHKIAFMKKTTECHEYVVTLSQISADQKIKLVSASTLPFSSRLLIVKKNNFTDFFVFYRRTRHFVESRGLCLSEFVACRREKNR